MHGDRTFTWRGWLGAAIILPAAVLACLSRPFVAPGTWGDMGLHMLAWCLLSAGIFVRLWATLYIGGRKSMALVTQGPYAMCRHPLYVGSFFIVVSLALFIESATVLAAVVAAILLYALGIIPSEEQHVVECFGEPYLAYCKVTPRFIPRLSQLGRPAFTEVKVAAFLRECARAFGCIMLGASVQILAYCRLQPWWPTPFRFP